MTLKFHNTLTGSVDEFVSQTADKVSLYTCGPTVYDYAHIGNWSSYIYWDTLVRILSADGYDVTRVMNITDVGHLTSDADEGEDKLEKGAKREGKTAWEIAEFYTDDFIKGMNDLGLITPTHIAKATDYIPQQLDLVRKLKQKGFTYQISDGIYFDTSKFPSYADFAHLNLDAQKAGARIGLNLEKRNPSDFALWKFTPPGEKRNMEWETPQDLVDSRWYIVDGNSSEDIDITTAQTAKQNSATYQLPPTNYQPMGFPGWHIECSAIAMSLLGPTLDIHTGGIDHIPVHHTNEIAQSEATTGVKFSNFWLHNNHLKVDGSKISKSLGNGYTLQNLAEKGFTPLDFKMLILQGNYRNEGNFTIDGLSAAKNRLHNWRNVAALRHQIHDTTQSDTEKNQDKKTMSLYATPHAVKEAIEDDLGTPEALRIIDQAFTTLVDTDLEHINKQALVDLVATIDSLLGLQLVDSTPDISDELKQIIIERNTARVNKDWDKSDKLRDELEKHGINLRDTNNNSVWEYA